MQKRKRSVPLKTSSSLLVHFDPELDLVLMSLCDTSNYGVGAVLAHRMPDGSKCPIIYASRSLSESQCNYSHFKKEALAVVFFAYNSFIRIFLDITSN